MANHAVVEIPSATLEQRQELLALMRDQLAGQFDTLQRVMGLTWLEFERLYETRGEVRAITVGGSLAGYCWLEPRNRVLHIHALFVFPAQRRRGVGRAALLAMEGEFRGGIELLELGVEEANSPARRLYERCGYLAEKALPEIGFLVMRKRLVEGLPPVP